MKRENKIKSTINDLDNHAFYMCPDVILLISTVHVHTMCTPLGTPVP